MINNKNKKLTVKVIENLKILGILIFYLNQKFMSLILIFNFIITFDH